MKLIVDQTGNLHESVNNAIRAVDDAVAKSLLLPVPSTRETGKEMQETEEEETVEETEETRERTRDEMDKETDDEPLRRRKTQAR